VLRVPSSPSMMERAMAMPLSAISSMGISGGKSMKMSMSGSRRWVPLATEPATIGSTSVSK